MYKNIIFDLGGVILNIDYQLTVDAFRKIGLSQFDAIYSQLAQSNLFDDFEMGKISPEKFRDQIRKKITHPLTDTEIDTAWNAMLLDLPKERIKLLEKLKQSHRIFLLSNTNAIHEKAYTADMIKQYGSNVLENHFEKVYLSHHVGMRKPQKEIFQFVVNENNLQPEETLFIDDSPQYIKGAKDAGLDAILLEKHISLLDLF